MKQKLSKQEAVILLSQMYLPWFNEKEKEAITMAIESLQNDLKKEKNEKFYTIFRWKSK